MQSVSIEGDFVPLSLVPDTRFDTLDKAIQNAILAHHSHRQDQGILDCASFFTYSSEGRSPAGSNKVDLVTEYGIVYHQGYRLAGGKLGEDGGCNVPTVLTFRVDDDGQYILAEYWEPRDGNLYPEDIKAKYPAFVWPDTQKNLFDQKIAVFNQVMEGFHVGPEVIIDHLITDICDRERWAGSFDDLMLMCELQRELLGYYGEDTLMYCSEQINNYGQDDIHSKVMTYVYNEISDSTLSLEYTTTANNDDLWSDGIVFDALGPNEEIVSTFEIILEEDNSSVECTIGHSRTGLTLIYGLVSDDGKEYSTDVVGGHGKETFKNLPAGCYRLFVRNSDYSGVPAYENPSDFPDVSFDAMGVMNYRIK